MKVFLDTEFYEIGQDGSMGLELISIGLVTLDGKEFYAESDHFDWNWVPHDHWLQDNVRPHLLGGYAEMSPAQMVNGVLDLCGPKPDLYGWYCDYDWVVLCSLFGRMVDLPDHFPRFCRDLKQTTKDLHIAKSELPGQDDDQHHALNDAKWNAQVYAYIKQIEVRLRESGVLPFLPTDHAKFLAANVNSFLNSAPYCAPEQMQALVDDKLKMPLIAYQEAVTDSAA